MNWKPNVTKLPSPQEVWKKPEVDETSFATKSQNVRSTYARNSASKSRFFVSYVLRIHLSSGITSLLYVFSYFTSGVGKRERLGLRLVLTLEQTNNKPRYIERMPSYWLQWQRPTTTTALFYSSKTALT